MTDAQEWCSRRRKICEANGRKNLAAYFARGEADPAVAAEMRPVVDIAANAARDLREPKE